MRDATPSEMQSVDETGVRQYANVMVEIKRRFRVIDHFMSGKNAAIYMPTTVETIGLQFRKILELIAFASLTANKKLYATAYANFSKHWEGLCTRIRWLYMLWRVRASFANRPCGSAPGREPERHGHRWRGEYRTPHAVCGAD
jgi:hypothetical protein